MNNMIIKNANIFGEIKNIRIEDGKFVSFPEYVDSFDIDAEGKRVIPGLIDTHTHGCIGYDTMDADFEPMCRFYAEHGITAWLPTTLTASFEDLLKVVKAKRDFKGAQILGFHLEGPYINLKYKGAQNPAFVRNPDLNEFKTLSRYAPIKMISLAPENEGAIEFIREITPSCVVAFGHTDCTYEQALAGFGAGASCLCHTYNAMPGIHHRNPGPIGAAIETGAYPQLICDGLHVKKPVVLITYKAFGKEKVVFISDSLRSAYLPDGVYESGGLTVYVKNGEARLEDGTIAGSGSTLLDCVKKAVEFGIPFEDAVCMASETPAKLLGLNKGRIEEGYDADLVILNNDLSVNTVIIAGEVFS